MLIVQFFILQDVDSSRSYINDLYSDDDNNKVQESLIYLKNVVIGSDKQKTIVISQGIVPRLMFLLSQDNTPLPIRYDAAIVLGELLVVVRVCAYYHQNGKYRMFFQFKLLVILNNLTPK